MQARYYDPLIGRFYSNDPIGFRDVYSFNRYVYANNNPYRFTDPDGKAPVSNRQLLVNQGFSDLSSFDSAQTEVFAEISGFNDVANSANALMSGDFKGAAVGLAIAVSKPAKITQKN